MPHSAAVDPTPLTAAQAWALALAATRELSWGLRAVSAEVTQWRALAAKIPDAPIRDDALYALAHKRTHADGAALFSVLPARRSADLLRLCVAYETILDFLDNVSERHTEEANGRELHLALIDAIDPDRPLADYYRYHPWDDDGGYLRQLVTSCRQWCAALPSFERVRPHLIREAERTQVLALNHIDDPAERDSALREWAETEFPNEQELTWFELGGAASASLVILALLALGAEQTVSEADLDTTCAVYWPWVSLVAVMLDSFADQAEDRDSGDHSYVAHYECPIRTVDRLCMCVRRAAQGALSLRRGHRHAVIVGCMVAMYLSKDSARSQQMRPSTRKLIRAGGSLCRLLYPILRLWRIAYSQRSS
jgi:tetraprenyl-beta-curcumene synthase